jgi:hypothetical protein
MPSDVAASAIHLARARRLARAARLDIAIGIGVGLAGMTEMAVAVIWGRGQDVITCLLVVQVFGLMGLLASVWGWALLDRAWLHHRTARGAMVAILAGKPGWAQALAWLEEAARSG